jgi:hypothetical protein
MDELLCPCDMDWDGKYILDDKLNDIFNRVPKGAHAEVFLDCCHSGTGLRDVTLGRPPELGPEHPTLDRFLPPPADISARVTGEEDDLAEPRNFRAVLRGSVVLWTGCRSDQTSADAYIDGAYNGAFT